MVRARVQMDIREHGASDNVTNTNDIPFVIFYRD